ncbi:MAG TPA: hypothetical protein VFY46_07095 [Acidimicrobiia bacterium]|nr:hypothetical protein [Acidimicrobiia bacterium]
MRRLAGICLIVLVAVACGGSGTATTSTGSEDDEDTPTTGAPGERDFVTFALGDLIRVNPDDGTSSVVASIEGNVTDITSGGGSVWLARDDGSVVRVSPSSGEVEAEIETGVSEQAIDLAYSDDAVWTLHGIPGIATTMAMIDPANNAAHHVITVLEGGAISAIAAGESAGWAIGGNSEKVTILYRLDPSSGDIAEFDTGVIGTDVTTGGGYVWISGFGFPDDGEGVEGVGKFDPATGTTTVYAVGNSSDSVAYTPEGVWLGDPLGDGGAFVHRIDPDTGETQASIAVGDAHSGSMPIYVGAGFIWVHSQDSDSNIYVIDPALDEVAGEGDSPGGFALLFP